MPVQTRWKCLEAFIFVPLTILLFVLLLPVIMWHGFYSLWMESCSTQGNRPINLIKERKEGRLVWKSQDSFLLINLNPLPIIGMKMKIHHHCSNDGSLSIPLALHHYSQLLLCMQICLTVLYFRHNPLCFIQQVFLSVAFFPSSVFTALQVKVIFMLLRFTSHPNHSDIKSTFVKVRHSDPGLSSGLSSCESKYSPSWCYLRTIYEVYDHNDIWVTRHVTHRSLHSSYTVYICGYRRTGIIPATVGTVYSVCGKVWKVLMGHLERR